MNIAHGLVILSSIISVLGISAYIKDTVGGKTKPNRVTWLMWTLAPLISTAAALSLGADPWATVRVFLAGFLPLLVFLSTFVNSKSYWKLSIFDIFCGMFSFLALLFWISLNSPEAAILFAIVADGFALLPTLRKAWANPETETGITYVANIISLLLIFPSIPEWNIENSAFQIFLIASNVLLVLVVYGRRYKRQDQRE